MVYSMSVFLSVFRMTIDRADLFTSIVHLIPFFDGIYGQYTSDALPVAYNICCCPGPFYSYA